MQPNLIIDSKVHKDLSQKQLQLVSDIPQAVIRKTILIIKRLDPYSRTPRNRV